MMVGDDDDNNNNDDEYDDNDDDFDDDDDIDYQRKLMGKQIRPKFSKDLLNLRKIQETLAKQKE